MSSKRRIRRKSCEGKRRHETHHDAMIEMCQGRVREGLVIYKCQFCHHYHVGHKTKAAKRATMGSRRK